MLRPRRLLLAGGAAGLIALAAAGIFISPAPAQAPGASALPEGPGREAVQAVCMACHQPANIAMSSGYTREQWAELTASMVSLAPELQRTVLDYLAEHYPPNNRRPATIVSGPLQVTFREWAAPQLGQRARDPVQGPDGMIWWVGQRGNLIGRLNPQTGQMREWLLPRHALPHSVNVDAQGRIWYMGNGNGTIGRLNPDTGEATEYHMPDPNARDPHTAEFDRNGIMWFTLQQSNMIGRFDPESGDIRLVSLSTPRARPYGVKIARDGTPWVACNGANCIVRVDPQTMELTEIRTPEGSTSRRLDIADDGMIWYVNSSLGRLGRYNPANGEIREWPTPSGPRSHPYAIAVIDGVVWFNESAVRPDPLVRFDPRTETFQSWPIPSGNIYAGIVRHMRATPDGNLLLHQDATNRIILATLPRAR